MELSSMRPLTLLEKKKDVSARMIIHGKRYEKLYDLARTHAVHQHAMDALFNELTRFPLCWFKDNKWADSVMTPDWALVVVREAILSISVLGYVAWKIRDGVVHIKIPVELDIEFVNGEWRCTNPEYNLTIINPPIRNVSCADINSSTSRSEKDTSIFDEMSENIRKRDFFNSRPSVFTTIDRNLKNQNGSSKQWFQQNTAGVVSAARTRSIDSNFQSLVQNRSASVRQLQQATALAREQLGQKHTLAGSEEPLEEEGNMMHREHVVTDGRETQPSRSLLSQTDGFQALNQTMYSIFFSYGVPPQILGRNINAERTGVNPRLNEMVLQSFFVGTKRLREQLSKLFIGVPLSGSVLKFKPTVSPYELKELEKVVKVEFLPTLYSHAYHVPESFFEPKVFKRRLQQELSTSNVSKKSKIEPDLTKKEKEIKPAEPNE